MYRSLIIYTSFLLASLGHAAPGTFPSNGCQVLQHKFGDLVAFPNSTLYKTENSEFWSLSAIMSPQCVFTPESTQDVADGLQILKRTRTKFGILTGGHMPIRGAASTNDGVLITMHHLNNNSLATIDGKPAARIGAGQRWIDVYDWLATRDLTCVGGRYAPVGVSGFILGGGVSYYQSARGWAVDHVLNYELVTADGHIKQVNARSNADLFWALKGGSNNYGILTRVDLEVFPLIDIWGGFVSQSQENIPSLIDAIASFADPKTGGVLDPRAAIAPTVQFNAEARSSTAITNLFYNGTTNSTVPSALQNFTLVPTSGPGVASSQSLLSFLNQTTTTGDRSERNLFRTGALKMTPEAVHLLYNTFNEVVTQSRNIRGGLINVGFQILSPGFLQNSPRNGNAIGIDPKDGPILTYLLGSSYTDEADSQYLVDFIKRIDDTIRANGKKSNLYYPFEYLNDCAGGQEPMKLYGNGKNIGRMREIALKYDPSGVFQNLASGAFKLTKPYKGDGNGQK